MLYLAKYESRLKRDEWKASCCCSTGQTGFDPLLLLLMSAGQKQNHTMGTLLVSVGSHSHLSLSHRRTLGIPPRGLAHVAGIKDNLRKNSRSHLNHRSMGDGVRPSNTVTSPPVGSELIRIASFGPTDRSALPRSRPLACVHCRGEGEGRLGKLETGCV